MLGRWKHQRALLPEDQCRRPASFALRCRSCRLGLVGQRQGTAHAQGDRHWRSLWHRLVIAGIHHHKSLDCGSGCRIGPRLGQTAPHSQSLFGLDRNNWIGLLPQDNTPTADWATFFVQHRLAPLVGMARDHQRINDGDVLRFERLYAALPDLLPQEKPALLHGDLWHGNALNTADGVVVVDPAAYYGHREMDVAMAGLFGGIGPDFFSCVQQRMAAGNGLGKPHGLVPVVSAVGPPQLVRRRVFGKGIRGASQICLKRSLIADS
jgi:hypothetical protein